MVYRRLRTSTAGAALAMATILVLTACGSGGEQDETEPSATQEASATEQWEAAHAFMADQTEDVEIVCRTAEFGPEGIGSIAAEDQTFLSFDDRSEWGEDTVTRADVEQTEQGVRVCSANVPASVRFEVGAINEFLGPQGLYFDAEGTVVAPDLDAVEILYAGGGADDPDAAFADAPGLWALRVALGPLGEEISSPEDVRSPADDATAQQYLELSRPALDWYGYEA